jgi:hypothetical protein
MQPNTHELKKTVFNEMLNMAGRVFLVVRYSENVVIGDRGFTQDELKKGIVLVFNNTMKFSWVDQGISAAMVFGAKSQECFIPTNDIVVIYSPELNAQFMTGPQPPAEDFDKNIVRKKEKSRKSVKISHDSNNVVRVDFQKKKEKATER